MQQLFQRLAPSCAMVLKKNPATGAVEFLGSAFAVRQDGYLFTAAEVVKGEPEVLISPAEDALGFQSTSREQLRCFGAQVAALDVANNVALLKLADPAMLRLPPELLGDSESIRPGAEIMHLGFPFGRYGSLVLTARTGRLAAKVLTPEGSRQLLVEGTVYSGSAGGPLIDARRGRIVGIIYNQLALLPREGKESESGRKLVLPTQTDLALAAPIEAAIALLSAAK
ncbi:MAG TPA: serine protease [Gammaproteobacteria bacterium]|jgi:S1-C subfamily serine protease|nr:serine protease [Gammaproteobacteria bacterium]